jgi:hypothetical protein
MIRKLFFAAALAATSLGIGASAPAAAQSYGAVTLSFGDGYYGRDRRHYGYRPHYRPYYRDRYYDWRARDRWERRHWRERERARRHYWRYQRDRDSRYRDDDDWRYRRGY